MLLAPKRPLSALAVLGCALLHCTGDAYLGAEPLASAVRPLRDAGMDSARPSTLVGQADASPTPDAGSGKTMDVAPLQLGFRAAGVSIQELVIACPQTCGTLDLAAQGGSPPYTFSWDDARTDSTRTLCPTSAGTLSASVRDALGHEQTATLPVRVIDCTPGRVCADNPSFEGEPTVGPEWLTARELDARPWEDCRAPVANIAASVPRIVAAVSGDEFPPPSEGNTYAYVPSRDNNHGAVSQTLCGQLSPGSVYAFKLDVAYAAEDRTGAPLEPGQLEIYAASAPCQRDQLLWTSPPLRTAWRTYCVTFKPQKPANALLFGATAAAGSSAAVFIDHIVPVASCP